jgi:tetratricopeptide (TPR) repeat protein
MRAEQPSATGEVSMNLMITTAALALAAVSAPAAAELGQYNSPPPSTEQMPGPAQQQSRTQAAAQAGPAIKPSSHALKALIDLQNAVKAKDMANIPAKLAAAQAVVQTKEDHYLLAQLQLNAAIDAKDDPAAAAAVDAMVATGLVDRTKTATLYKGVGELFYQAKQFDKAVAAFNKSVALNPQDYETLDLIGESYIGAGQKEQAAAAFEHAIQARSAAGQKAQELIYKKALQLAYDARSPNTMDIARQWIAAYPSPTGWHDTVGIYRDLNRPDTEGTLDLLRLLQANSALSTPGDYALFAEAAAEQSNFNEAQAVVDEGIASHQIDPSSAQFRQLIAALKTKPKATAADLVTAAKTSPSPLILLRIGDRYYAMRDYAHAADIDRQVLAKPGADRDLVNLHLGMALARAGDKSGATAALNAVTGPRAGIAKLWLLYVQQHA